MKKRLNALLSKLNIADDGEEREATLDALRLWVMYDRDADQADLRQPSLTSTQVFGIGEEIRRDTWRLPHHRLGRRGIENYLPKDALSHWANRGGRQAPRRLEAVRAFFAEDVSQEQRNCFDMKEGLSEFLPKRQQRHALREQWDAASSQEEREQISSALPLRPPLDSLPAMIRSCLVRGFGEACATLFSCADLDDSSFEEVFLYDGEPSPLSAERGSPGSWRSAAKTSSGWRGLS